MAAFFPFPADLTGASVELTEEARNPPQVVSLTWFIVGGWTLLVVLVLGSVFFALIRARHVDLELLAGLVQAFLPFMLTMGSNFLTMYLTRLKSPQGPACRVHDTFESSTPAARSTPPGSAHSDRILSDRAPSINHAPLKKRLVQAAAWSTLPGSANSHRILSDRTPSINHAPLRKRLVQAKAKYQVTFVGTYPSTSDGSLDGAA